MEETCWNWTGTTMDSVSKELAMVARRWRSLPKELTQCGLFGVRTQCDGGDGGTIVYAMESRLFGDPGSSEFETEI